MSSILRKRWCHLQRILQRNVQFFFTPKTTYCATHDKIACLTSESNPANHTKNDIGLIYKIENPLVWECLFQPMKTLQAEFFEESQTFGGTHILIRKPALEIINFLKHANYDNPINKYVLYGKNGSGVSTTMLHVLHYAHLSQWLIVHVPSVVQWLTKKTERVQSSLREGLFDLPILGSAWLSHFKNQNLKVINELDLRLHNDHTWNIQEENKKGESLLSLLDHGITRGVHSCNVIIAVLDEVKLLSKSGKVKTLVAIDDYSVIFHPGRKSSNKKYKYIGPEQLSFMEAFKNLAEPDWHNGAALLACQSEKNIRSDLDHFPLNKLTRYGFEFLDPFVPVEVPRLTNVEMTSLFNFFVSKKWISITEMEKELKILSTGNMKTFKRLCAPL